MKKQIFTILYIFATLLLPVTGAGKGGGIMGIPIKALFSAVIILFVSLFSFQAFAEEIPRDFEVSLYSAPVLEGAQSSANLDHPPRVPA